jgi:hypothetical protein
MGHAHVKSCATLSEVKLRDGLWQMLGMVQGDGICANLDLDKVKLA